MDGETVGDMGEETWCARDGARTRTWIDACDPRRDVPRDGAPNVHLLDTHACVSFHRCVRGDGKGIRSTWEPSTVPGTFHARLIHARVRGAGQDVGVSPTTPRTVQVDGFVLARVWSSIPFLVSHPVHVHRRCVHRDLSRRHVVGSPLRSHRHPRTRAWSTPLPWVVAHGISHVWHPSPVEEHRCDPLTFLDV